MPGSTVLLSAAPRETPFLTQSGRVNEAWLTWFSSITQNATVIQDLTAQVGALADGDRPRSGLDEDTLALLSAPRLPAPVADDVVDLLPLLLSFRADLEELRTLVVAGDPTPLGSLGSAAFQSSSAFDAAGAAAAVQSAILPSSAWQTYAPTVTPAGSMTVGTVTVNVAQYLIIGPAVLVEFDLTFTLGGTASTAVTISLPVTPVGSNNQPMFALQNTSSLGWVTPVTSINQALSAVTIYAGANSVTTNYPLGSTVTLRLNSKYRWS